MKRTVITMDGNGELSIPSNLKDLWMSEGELVDMLHVTAPETPCCDKVDILGRFVAHVGGTTETGNLQGHLANDVWFPDGCCPLFPYRLLWCCSVSGHHHEEVVRGKREK